MRNKESEKLDKEIRDLNRQLTTYKKTYSERTHTLLHDSDRMDYVEIVRLKQLLEKLNHSINSLTKKMRTIEDKLSSSHK